MRHIFLISMIFITAATASEMTMQPEKKPAASYMLGTGSSGQERLDRMEQAYGEFSQALLKEFSLPDEVRILSVGCGTGTRECKMAQEWPHAHIIAIDNSEKQIALARQQAAKLGLTNIEFCEEDVEALSDENSFGLVYGRFLLIHVKNPRAILSKMIRAAKPGGFVVCEELASSSLICEPEDQYHSQAVQLVQTVAEKMKTDSNFGLKLKDAMIEQGLGEVVERRLQPDSSKRHVKELLLATIAEAKPNLVAAKFDEQHLDQLLNGMQSHASQEHSRISMSDLFQVVGVKPQ